MDNTFQLVSKLNTLMSQYVIKRLEEEGINDLVLSHGQIIMSLKEKKEANMQEISALVGKTPQTVTTLIKKLEKENYISITKSKEDKRNKIVSLTQKGEDFIPVMITISKELYELQFIDIYDTDKETMRNVLKQMIENFTGE